MIEAFKSKPLNILNLSSCFILADQEHPGNLVFVGFPNLKYLELRVLARGYHINILLAWTHMAEVSPLLLEFKLQVCVNHQVE